MRGSQTSTQMSASVLLEGSAAVEGVFFFFLKDCYLMGTERILVLRRPSRRSPLLRCELLTAGGSGREVHRPIPMTSAWRPESWPATGWASTARGRRASLPSRALGPELAHLPLWLLRRWPSYCHPAAQESRGHRTRGPRVCLGPPPTPLQPGACFPGASASPRPACPRHAQACKSTLRGCVSPVCRLCWLLGPILSGRGLSGGLSQGDKERTPPSSVFVLSFNDKGNGLRQDSRGNSQQSPAWTSSSDRKRS